VADNILIGTDGDGVNDENEANVFGGVASTGWANAYLWSAHATNVVVAGNWYGIGIDGVTRFTNSSVIVHGFPRTATARFGSDFDGVSDALEGNVLYNNNPFPFIYNMQTNLSYLSPESVFDGPNPSGFSGLNPGVRLSFRGNVTVNNNLIPCNYADGSFSLVSSFVSYESNYMNTATANVPADIIPSLDLTNSTIAHLKGRFPQGLPPYTNISIDVYQLDQQGWTNGQLWLESELTDLSTYTNGFPQGSKYLKSFSVTNSGSFDVNLTGLDLGPGKVTVTANYSADPAGVHNGRTHTSNFSDPITFAASTPGNLALSISLSGTNVTLAWPTNAGTVNVQSSTKLNPASWSNLSPQPPTVVAGSEYHATLHVAGSPAFFRLAH
jgi:hypothetical protein